MKTKLNINVSDFYIEEDINDIIKYEYLNIPKNSKYYKKFCYWLKTDVYQYNRTDNKMIMNILTAVYGYNGNSEYPHKRSMSNFLDEYLPIVLFKITYKNDYIHLTPLNNINSNNKLLSENKVYICI